MGGDNSLFKKKLYANINLENWELMRIAEKPKPIMICVNRRLELNVEVQHITDGRIFGLSVRSRQRLILSTLD